MMSIEEIINYEYPFSFTGTEYLRSDVMKVIKALIERILSADKWYETRKQNLDLDIKSLKSLAKLLKKNNKKGFFINPEYFRNKSGRYYVKGVCSLQRFPAYIRNTLIDRTQYSDLDIVNCCPSILKNLTDSWDIPNTYITKYCNDRDEMMLECIDKMKLSKSNVKQLFIRLMFGGSYASFLTDMIRDYPEFNTDYEICWLKPLFDELKAIANTLYNDNRCEQLKKIVNQKKKDNDFQGIKKGNISGSFLAHLLFTIENFIVHLMRDFMGKQGFSMDTIIFDGGFIRLKEKQNEDAKIISIDNIRDCEAFIYEKSGMRIALKVKEFEEFYSDEDIYCDKVDEDGVTEVNGIEFENSWLFDGVRTDADVAEKLSKICPNYFKYCKTVLYGFNNKIGMWSSDGEQIVKQYVYEYSDYFRVFKLDRVTGLEYVSDESYGRNDSSLKKIAPIIKLLSMDDDWVDRTDRTSIGKLLFKNGIFDFADHELYEFDPDVVFYNRIDMDYTEQTEQTKEWSLKVYDILFKDAFKENDGQANYLIQAFYNGLRGKVDLKNFYFCVGNTNSCKGTTCNAMEEAFGDFVGTFNGEILAYSNNTQDEAMKMRPFYLARHKRLLFGNEINMKTILNGNIIKKASSGGDKLQGRGMRENETNFYLQTSVFTFVNDVPKISPFDDGMRDRLKFIEYPYTFVNKKAEDCKENEKPADTNIKRTLTKSWFKIGLQHLILHFGKHLYENMNMQEPEEMKSIMDNWTGDMTLEGQLEQSFKLTERTDDRIKRKELTEWRKKQGIDMSDRRFNQELRKIGLNEAMSNGTRYWTGIKWLVDDEVDSEVEDEH